MNNTAPTPTKTKNASDGLFSTFWWRINLDTDMKVNKANTIYGYSKFRDHPEAKDKQYLLMKSVILMAKYGTPTYLNRSLSIQYYKRAGHIVNKEHDPLLFTLYKNQYVIDPEFLDDHALITFLTKFYEMVKSGADISGLIPKPKVRQPGELDDMLNVSGVQIPSPIALTNYCDRLMHSGFGFGEVQHFYKKYLEMKGW